jgi:hypothetical protein
LRRGQDFFDVFFDRFEIELLELVTVVELVTLRIGAAGAEVLGLNAWATKTGCPSFDGYLLCPRLLNYPQRKPPEIE